VDRWTFGGQIKILVVRLSFFGGERGGRINLNLWAFARQRSLRIN
jgi:hypothetical protein